MSTSSVAAHDRLFAGLTPTVRGLAKSGTLRSYRKNTVILNEGEAGDSTFVLLAGKVKLYSIDASGREITHDVVEAGDYFAEMWLDGGPRCVSVMTLEPSVCSIVGCVALREQLAASPDFVFELMVRVVRRAREATRKVRELALLDVYGRVKSTLEGHKGSATPESPIHLTAITHQIIASRVGASREMVSRLLKDLERGGYIDLGVKRITLKRKLPARW